MDKAAWMRVAGWVLVALGVLAIPNIAKVRSLFDSEWASTAETIAFWAAVVFLALGIWLLRMAAWARARKRQSLMARQWR